MGEHVYHPDGAHAQLRNSVMRSKTQADWYEAVAWLYGSNALEENNFGG
jgi:salicylate hydroxylase